MYFSLNHGSLNEGRDISKKEMVNKTSDFKEEIVVNISESYK